MSKYIEMTYLDSEGHGRATGMGAMGNNDAETARLWDAAQSEALWIGRADFLCDLHADNGDIIESIAIDRDGFSAITGEPAKTENEYLAIDKNERQRSMATGV